MTPYRTVPRVRPDVLICAGLDPSGGAGFVADTRVVHELGGRPVGIVTALTVQNTTGVVGVAALDPAQIRDQLEYLLTDVEVRAVKIGMIGSTPIAQAIAAALALTSAPVVWDPIIYPSRGDVPLADSLFGGALEALAPHLTLLTPNARELGYLSSRAIHGQADAVAAATELARRLDAAVLVKAGHLATDEAIDVIVHRDQAEELPGARIPGGADVHGTGCALASAIATHLALGLPLAEACRAAKQYVAHKIAHPVRPGRGAAAVV